MTKEEVAREDEKKRPVWKRRVKVWRLMIPLWVLIVVFGCCLMSAGTIGLGAAVSQAPDPTATLEPTERPEPTETDAPIPTSTPEPTATLEPTETVEPTETLEPTEEPTERPTSTATEEPLGQAEVEYMDAVLSIADRYAELFTLFSEYAGEASRNPSLFVDSTWIQETGTVLGLIRVVNNEVRALECPESCEGIQLHLSRAADHYDAFTQLFAEGVDEMDASKIERATEKVGLGNEAIDKATERIEELE